MTNQFPTPSGPSLNPTGIWVSGFLLGLLVGLVPWAISVFLPRGEKPTAQQQSLNVISPAPKQEGFSIPQNQSTPTATPAATSSESQPVAAGGTTSGGTTSGGTTSGGTTSGGTTSGGTTSQPSLDRTSTTNVNVSTRPIPARW